MTTRVGFFGILGLIFITLKLTAVIDWAWLWVLAPLWGPLAVYLVVLTAVLIGAFIVALLVAVGKECIRK